MEKERKNNRSLNRLFISTLTLIILTVWVIGLGEASSAPAAKPGGTLQTVLFPEPGSLDPHTEFFGSEVIVNLYNSLLRWDKQMTRLEPDLAESFSQPDDVTYVFKLRKGVRFHNIPPVNGRELTSQDVKYSIERMLGEHGEKARFPHRFRLAGQLESIATPDPLTIIFKTKEPYAPFLNYIATFNASLVPREAVENFKDLRNQAIGTGPFMLKEWVRGSHIHLVRNPDYFRKGFPYLDGVKYSFAMSEASFLSGMISGTVDFSGLFPAQIPALREKAPQLTLVKQKGMRTVVMRASPWFENQLPKPPLDKKEVRKVVALAIDRNRLVKVAAGGMATPQIASVPNWPPYSLDEKEPVEFNPAKGKRLLADAGYPNGVAIEVMALAFPDVMKAGQVVQEMLKEVGIQADLKPLPAAQWTNRMLKFDYQMWLGMLPPPCDPGQILTGSFGRTATSYRWANQEIYQMVDEQNKTMDPKRRATLIQQTYRKLLEEGPDICLFATDRFWGFQPWVFPKDEYYFPFQNYSFEGTWMEKK